MTIGTHDSSFLWGTERDRDYYKEEWHFCNPDLDSDDFANAYASAKADSKSDEWATAYASAYAGAKADGESDEWASAFANAKADDEPDECDDPIMQPQWHDYANFNNYEQTTTDSKATEKTEQKISVIKEKLEPWRDSPIRTSIGPSSDSYLRKRTWHKIDIDSEFDFLKTDSINDSFLDENSNKRIKTHKDLYNVLGGVNKNKKPRPPRYACRIWHKDVTVVTKLFPNGKINLEEAQVALCQIRGRSFSIRVLEAHLIDAIKKWDPEYAKSIEFIKKVI